MKYTNVPVEVPIYRHNFAASVFQGWFGVAGIRTAKAREALAAFRDSANTINIPDVGGVSSVSFRQPMSSLPIEINWEGKKTYKRLKRLFQAAHPLGVKWSSDNPPAVKVVEVDNLAAYDGCEVSVSFGVFSSAIRSAMSETAEAISRLAADGMPPESREISSLADFYMGVARLGKNVAANLREHGFSQIYHTLLFPGGMYKGTAIVKQQEEDFVLVAGGEKTEVKSLGEWYWGFDPIHPGNLILDVQSAASHGDGGLYDRFFTNPAPQLDEILNQWLRGERVSYPDSSLAAWQAAKLGTDKMPKSVLNQILGAMRKEFGSKLEKFRVPTDGIRRYVLTDTRAGIPPLARGNFLLTEENIIVSAKDWSESFANDPFGRSLSQIWDGADMDDVINIIQTAPGCIAAWRSPTMRGQIAFFGAHPENAPSVPRWTIADWRPEQPSSQLGWREIASHLAGAASVVGKTAFLFRHMAAAQYEPVEILATMSDVVDAAVQLHATNIKEISMWVEETYSEMVKSGIVFESAFEREYQLPNIQTARGWLGSLYDSYVVAYERWEEGVRNNFKPPLVTGFEGYRAVAQMVYHIWVTAWTELSGARLDAPEEFEESKFKNSAIRERAEGEIAEFLNGADDSAADDSALYGVTGALLQFYENSAVSFCSTLCKHAIRVLQNAQPAPAGAFLKVYRWSGTPGQRLVVGGKNGKTLFDEIDKSPCGSISGLAPVRGTVLVALSSSDFGEFHVVEFAEG